MVFTITYNLLEGTSMVFTITTYYLLEGTSMVFTITTYYNPVRRHLYVYHVYYGVYSIITYYNPVRRHLYGVYHHNLLQSC